MMGPVCPVHFNGGPGHDDRFPACTLMALVNSLLKVLDKRDCEGKNGCVEIYMCGTLMEMGV